MKRFGHCAIGVSWLLLFASVGAAAATDVPPADLHGSWLVTTASVDLKDQPHWRYEPDDPRLLHRVLTVSADGTLRFDFTDGACSKVVWTPARPGTVADLVRESFTRAPHPDLPRHPSLEDFGPALANPSILPLRARCSDVKRADGSDRFWGDGWFALLDASTLLFDYEGDALLVLRKIGPSTPPSPSFPCSGARTPTERAICGSQVLSGLDRSLAAAYQRQLQRLRGRNPDATKKDQQAWIAERDACKDDAACIEGRMRARLDELMQD